MYIKGQLRNSKNATKMNPTERLNLKKMLAQSQEYVDHTEDIRRLKHSGLLLDSMRDIEKLKRANAILRADDPEAFADLCKTTAPLMYSLYTDLFNKLIKDEINLAIMIKLIRVLELIEQGQMDQNEGSVMVGKILKEMYVDSAVRLGEKLDKANDLVDAANEALKVERTPAKQVSWHQWAREHR